MVSSYKRIYIGIADSFSTDTSGNPVANNLTLYGPYTYTQCMNASFFKNLSIKGKYMAYTVYNQSGDFVGNPVVGILSSPTASGMGSFNDGLGLKTTRYDMANYFTYYSFMYIPQDAVFTQYSNSGYSGVTVTSASAGIIYGTRAMSMPSVEYVYSSNRNAYPDDGEMNGDWYSYIGSANDDIEDRLHYGELFVMQSDDKTVTVVFPRAPKFVIIPISNREGILNMKSEGSIEWDYSCGRQGVGVTTIYPGSMKITLYKDGTANNSKYYADCLLKGKTLTITSSWGYLYRMFTYGYPSKFMYFW